jgi:hypothetical protein
MQKTLDSLMRIKGLIWLRGQDLNLRPSGYEPDELPGCSTPRAGVFCVLGRPGGDLLSRVLRRSTIGAEGFHGRVRDGIGCTVPRNSHQVIQGHYFGLVLWVCVSRGLLWVKGLSLRATLLVGMDQADRAISTS